MPANVIPSEYPSRIYDAAIAVVKAKFPDYLQAADGYTISADKDLPGYVNGEHDKKEKTIKIAAPQDDKGTFTSNNVMNFVGTILHELHHARDLGAQGSKTSYERNIRQLLGQENDPKFWENSYGPLMEKAQDQGLPSIDKTNYFGNTAEFMATAVPMLDMRDRGINGQYLKNIEEIIKQVPEMENVIKANRYPEIKTFK